MKVLHGLTGSVATTISHLFPTEYNKNGWNHQCVVTKSSDNFSGSKYFFQQWNNDESEWYEYENDNKVLHIELSKWADVFVIAPLSANTLAKIANGICDNLLTCVARAWDFNKPFIVAPAMNTNMWNHPITKEHLDKISSWGIKIVPPIEKTLFCGDTGIGAMANIDDIINLIK